MRPRLKIKLNEINNPELYHIINTLNFRINIITSYILSTHINEKNDDDVTRAEL
jgi:hypothetical protein